MEKQMRIARRLSRHSASAFFHRRLAGEAFRVSSATACLLAIFLSAGGHWAVLQSFAYTRMLVEFAQKYSLSTAVKKTFDGHYSCSLCPKIRAGYNEERKVPQRVGGAHSPEFIVQIPACSFLLPAAVADLPFVRSLSPDFLTAPPKPPPRVV